MNKSAKEIVLVLGATSDIARASAHRFAADGHPLILAARNAGRLEKDAEDIRIRYQVDVSTQGLDILQPDQFEAFVSGLAPLPDIVICAVGVLGSQAEDERNAGAAIDVIRTNFEGPAILLGLLANAFEDRGSGTIIGISSVAGDRGRATNYIYGSAKAGFSAFLSGLRNRLAGKGIQVVTIKPGFVNTKMIEGMDTPKPLTAEPAQAGEAIYKAWQKKRDVAYIKPIWWLVMTIICSIPERLFKRLKL